MSPLNLDLSGRVAVVTGGAGELGRPICRTLANCGARVAIHYHTSADKAKGLASEIKSSGGVAECFSADVTDLAATKNLSARVRSHFGGDADIIVNGAVIQYDWTSVLDQAIEDYESQFRSCVLHNVNMAKAFVPGMVKKGKGRVIGINTECAMQNFPSQSAYVSGKRGMDGVLRVLAKEVGRHNITVNQVAPGWMRSERIRNQRKDPQVSYAKEVPMKRAGDDQEIANLVAFLASDLAGYITGAYIPVCGGNVMPAI